MKSIVLCESTLVEQNDHDKGLKEAKANENGNEEVSNKIANGNSGDESSGEVELVNVEGNIKSFCSKDDKISERPAEKEASENDEKSFGSAASSNNSGEDYLVATEEKEEGDRNVNRANLSSVGEPESTKKVDALAENEISYNDSEGHSEESALKSSNEQKRKPSLEDAKKEEDAAIKTTVEKKTSKEDSPSEMDIASDKILKSKESSVDENNKNVDNEDREESVEEILLNEDENKENEKERKGDFPGSRKVAKEQEEHPSGCEIQVGECQTVSESDKNSMWNEKPEQDLEENTLSSTQEKSETSGEELHSSETIDEEDVKILKSEKERRREEEGEEEVEDMQIVLDESEDLKGEVGSGEGETSGMELDESQPNQTVGSSKSEEDRCSDSQVEFFGSRKRQLQQQEAEHFSVKKKRLWGDDEDGGEGDGDGDVDKEEEAKTAESSDVKAHKIEDSSRPESPASRDTTTSSSSKVEFDSQKVSSTKKTCDDAENVEKSKTSTDGEEERPKTQSGEKEAFPSSFLASLRGTLKGLTRSDLEELIIQKLCEVITERSNVGELRRKAQALEQDQERWKEKVKSLTKLVREMEMVMKKYMTEVQKQTKEGDSQIVTPLKVTRSVGLQVSFFCNANKASKPTVPQPATSGVVQNVNGRNPKTVPLKIPSQLNVYPKTVWNKPPVQKSSPTPMSLVNHLKKPMRTRSDYLRQNRSSLPQSLLHNNRGIQGQASGIRQNAKSVSVTQSPQKPQQQQQQNNNTSKVIDLTEDDDRQTGSVGKTTGPIRVVSNLSQQSQQGGQNNRYAYILPASSVPPGSSAGGQSRQVLIATPTMPQPNRQLMCSMPPLLFKGGNVVPQQGPQSQIINQSNRIVYPKNLRQHPAPLPQPPINQTHRPNLKLLPPRPALKISKVQSGIVLSWNMSLGPEHAPISSYQLYAYQESNSPPATSLWKKVGDVKALPLPMACTLTQFMSGHKYHFAVRAVDLHSRIGPFSFPGTIVLVK